MPDRSARSRSAPRFDLVAVDELGNHATTDAFARADVAAIWDVGVEHKAVASLKANPHCTRPFFALRATKKAQHLVTHPHLMEVRAFGRHQYRSRRLPLDIESYEDLEPIADIIVVPSHGRA